MSRSANEFRGEPVCTVFQIFFGREKLWGDRGSMRAVVSRFPPEIFCFTVPKNFVAESFSVSLIPILKKSKDRRGRAGFTIFCRNCFGPQYLNVSLRNPSLFHKISVIEKYL